MDQMTEGPLKDTRLVTLALNVPGPVAASRLVKLGASAIKVEPPSGDPLSRFAGSWYHSLTQQQTVVTLDLKNSRDWDELDRSLAEADLLLTSFRPSALKRLRLDWETLHRKHQNLCALNIVGYSSPDEEVPGHDLTYQARLGLLQPPQLPLTLFADLAGAERAVSVSLALLMNFARTRSAEFAQVSLYETLLDLAMPLTVGLTASNGPLGGGFPLYGLYQARKGWIAVAALEPAFAQRLTSELNLSEATFTNLEIIFKQRTAQEWEQWAKERDLPLAVVSAPGDDH